MERTKRVLNILVFLSMFLYYNSGGSVIVL